jgi:hypothetical protein
MKASTIVIIVLCSIIGLAILIPTCAGISYFGEAAAVTREQLAPRELLRKYEWFKDAAAALDAKSATIERIRSQGKLLEGTPRAEWAREDRQQWNVWQSELTGTIGSYNLLAADYNAAMAKINYAFCNVGEMPRGLGAPLPREFRSYQEK